MEAENKKLNSIALRDSSSLLKRLQPYLFISITGLLAFAPVSFMLRALKNDIVAIEYPIKYFISECIHNGEVPVWFNTWAMGFPLQSNLTWGIYSTPQLFFSSLFNYNMYVLHIEFMFYVLLAGWSMFYLLKKHFSLDGRIAQIIACCYMLSGFVTGSSQWLLYITAAAFAPLVLHFLLQLFKFPSLKNSFLFAVFYFLMFTNVYQAFNIISSYCIVGFLIFHIVISWKEKKYLQKLIRSLGITAIFIFIFCGPCLYFSLEVLQYLERGKPIEENLKFFNSNYLHPAGLSSLLMPMSVTKLSYANTEGTMMNSYMGLFTLLTLPVVFLSSIREKRRSVLILLSASIIFLLISFGAILPFRNIMNIFPGLSYFRNPGLFRFYFILFLLLATAIYFSKKKMEDVINFRENKRLLKFIFILIVITFIVLLIFQLINAKAFDTSSIEKIISEISLPQTILINSLIQIFLLGLLFFIYKKRKTTLFKYLFAADMIANTLLCTPFFTVSSYTLKETDNILSKKKGFPVQTISLEGAAASFTDEKNNDWYNINVFKKEVSGNTSYWGPLVLKNYSPANDQLVSIENGNTNSDSIKIILQKPSHLKVKTTFSENKTIRVHQNYFPGWKAYFNDKPISVTESSPGFTVSVPAGQGMLDIKFEKNISWLTAFLIHIIVAVTILFLLIQKFRNRSFEEIK